MANGTIAFDTLTTSDSKNTNTEKSIDTSYIYNGVAKQWLHFNQDTPATRDSFNTSSVSDEATGKYDVTFTSAFSNTEHLSACGHTIESNSADNFSHTEHQNLVSTTTHRRSDFENNARQDETYSVTITFGDLA